MPDGRDDRGRVVEREVGQHAELVVDRHLPELEPDRSRRLLDGEVRVLGGVDDSARPKRSRGRERRQRRRRRGVLDVAVQAGRQPEELREPVQRDLLELGRRRRGRPRHRIRVQRRDQQLGEDPRLRPGVRRSRRRSAGDSSGSAPGRSARRGRAGRRRRARAARARDGQPRPQLARPHGGNHRPLGDPLQVGRDPLGRGREIVTEAHPGRRFRIRSTCFHVLVLTTSSFVSQARRAWPTPSST